MHVRGTATSLTDPLHIVDTIGMILSMLLFIVFGAVALGKAFRVYSIATILAIVGGAVLAFAQVNAMVAGSTTPWMGIVERLNIYSMLLWVAVFAIALLRAEQPEPAEGGG